MQVSQFSSPPRINAVHTAGPQSLRSACSSTAIRRPLMQNSRTYWNISSVGTGDRNRRTLYVKSEAASDSPQMYLPRPFRDFSEACSHKKTATKGQSWRSRYSVPGFGFWRERPIRCSARPMHCCCMQFRELPLQRGEPAQ